MGTIDGPNTRKQHYTVIEITEMWWHSSHDYNTVMGGYSLFRNNRQGEQGCCSIYEGFHTSMQGELGRPTHNLRCTQQGTQKVIKAFYNYVKSRRKTTNPRVIPILSQNAKSNLVVDDAKNAEGFNVLFSSVFTNRGRYQMLSTVGSKDREDDKKYRVTTDQGLLEFRCIHVSRTRWAAP